MSAEYRPKFKWQSILGAIALTVGTLGILESPVQAIPEVSASSTKVAQVGIRSRINRPTPINLTPRTHIPLPSTNRSRDYYPHSRSRHHHEYGYDDHHHHRQHRHSHQGKGTVIIINSGSSSRYINYSNHNGHIRVIGK